MKNLYKTFYCNKLKILLTIKFVCKKSTVTISLNIEPKLLTKFNPAILFAAYFLNKKKSKNIIYD